MGFIINSGGPSLEAIRDALLSNDAPKSERSSASAGVSLMAPREDHTHPRITWSGLATTDVSGIATFDFSAKPFDLQPVAVLAYYEASQTSQPVALRVFEWTMNAGGKFVGCKVKAMRSQAIPQNLATLLLGAVFNLFAGAANGVQVNLVLLPQSSAV